MRDDESARAWFYRILRRTIIDLYRRRHVEQRALAKMAPEEPDAAEINVIGRCLDRLILNLKSDYEKIIRAVDIEQRSIAAVANELQISTTM